MGKGLMFDEGVSWGTLPFLTSKVIEIHVINFAIFFFIDMHFIS